MSVLAVGERLRADRWLLLGLAVGLGMVLGHLGLMPLLNPDEGRNAAVAQEMLTGGSWLVPTLDGLPYLDKPALYFKLVALSLGAFGRSEAAARLPSALAALGVLALVYGFCRTEYDRRTAAIAVAIVATAPLFFTLAHTVIFDMPLALCVVAAIFAGYRAEAADPASRRRWYLGFAAAAGLGILVKGPVGLVVPVLVLLPFNWIDGRRDSWHRLLAPRNLLLIVAIVLPWFVGVSLQHGDFPYYGLVRETLLRFATGELHRTQPFYFYLPVVLGTFFAWSLLLPEAAVLTWQRRHRLSRPDRLFLVWAVVVVLFFSISQSKLAGYILTAIIALGVLAARVVARAVAAPESRSARLLRRASWALAVIAMLGGLAALAGALTPALGAPAWAALGRWSRLGAALPAAARPIVAPLIATLLLVGLAASLAAWRRVPALAFAAFLSLPLLAYALPLPGSIALAELRSDRGLARRLADLGPKVEIACLGCFPPGLTFYLNRRVTVISGADGAELTSNYIRFVLAQAADWPEQVVPRAQFANWLDARHHPVYLLATGPDSAPLATLPGAPAGGAERPSGGYWGILLP
jgi:4-amino-4-deoxy-L-arabinose transferase-like glycosyltransferase